MKKSVSLVLFCVLTGILGCGYTTQSTLPGNLKTVHVQLFKNKINFASESGRNVYFPLLEVKTRNAIMDRFLFDGRLKPVNEDDADLVLKGELINYERTGLRFSDNDDVQEYRIHVIVSLELYDSQTQSVKWSEPSFGGEATYFLTGPSAKSEESAIEDAIQDLAKRVVERTIEDW